MLLKFSSLCRAQVPGPGQAEFRESPSMNFSNTRFQMWANGWEAWGRWVRVVPAHPVPCPDHLRSRWVSSVPEVSHVRDLVSRNDRALILVVRREGEAYVATCQRQSFSFVIWNVCYFFSFPIWCFIWILALNLYCRQFPCSCGLLFIAVHPWPTLSESQRHPPAPISVVWECVRGTGIPPNRLSESDASASPFCTYFDPVRQRFK